MIQVRLLAPEELPAASDVLWKSYYAAENGKTSLEGMTTFRDLVAPLSLQMNAFAGDVLFYGAFDRETMVGVGAVKDASHVLLLYVLPQEQRRGVGSRLLKRLLRRTGAAAVTVNAAPDAVPFYEKHGFVAVASLQVKDGIRFIPMILRRIGQEDFVKKG